MNIQLSFPSTPHFNATLSVTGSKSESNRLLLLRALYPNLEIDNLSNSDDARVMEKGLNQHTGVVDIHHAGTAMRFLTAFFATRPDREVVLTGSRRMTERPVKILVEALQSLGADISYEGLPGYPPLRIRGKRITAREVQLPAHVSSQYISALILVAPQLENGLELELIGEVTSVPYIKMTLGLLDRLGIRNEFKGNNIRVSPQTEIRANRLVVESDWSSASYFYSIAALSETGSQITLSSYYRESLQGDSILAAIYEDFGVETQYGEQEITLIKRSGAYSGSGHYQLANAPDIAQTLAVTCYGLGLPCELSGLHTLKIKETDRLVALETELGKLGARISVTDRALKLEAGGTYRHGVAIDTYNDHRMAMAFAPLAIKIPLVVNDAGVVSKSYPDFWKDLRALNFTIREQA